MDSMTKRDHFIRVKSSKGNFSSVVRERYLREDISCHSGICKKCIQGIFRFLDKIVFFIYLSPMEGFYDYYLVNNLLTVV